MPAAVGLFLPQLRMSAATIEARVRVAEEEGLHSIWLIDHMAPPALAEADMLEGWTLATFLAARTSTIRIGHLVLCASFRSPAVMAKMAVTLDVLSGGRLELGLGWGSVPDEISAYGISDDGPAARAAWLADTIEVLRLMETGEPFDYDGRRVTLRNAIGRPTPVQGRIPLHLGGAGPKLTLPLVKAHADWWNCPTYGLDRLDELRPSVGSARISLQRVVGLAPSAAQRDEVVAQAERRFGGWGGGVLAGTPDEVAAVLQADIDRGVELFVIQLADFGAEDTIRLLAREVIPALH